MSQTERNPQEQGDSKPDLDAVLVWLSFTVERDYIDRSVFPAMRRERAVRWTGGSMLFYLTVDEAEALREDAQARRESVRGAVKNAVGKHAQALGDAIEEGRTRRATFAAAQPVCAYKSEYSEDWHGTKEQLLAMGICLPGPWPGEPGGKARWARATDSRGYPLNITRHCTIWGTFRARIDIPQEVRREAESHEERAKKLTYAQQNLNRVPRTSEDFLWDCVENVRRMFRVYVNAEPSDFHGYTLTEESVSNILMSMDEVVDAIVNAEVAFDAERQQKVLLKYQKEIADLDGSFQRKLSLLTKRNPALLEGSPS